MNHPTSTPKFRVTPPVTKAPVDPRLLEDFGSAAGKSPTLPGIEQTVSNISDTTKAIVLSPKATAADRTKGYLLRLLPEQFERVEQVFAHSTFKSKQKMGEELFMEAIENLAKKLRV